MSQTEKAAYFQALKAAGTEFDKHYREYSTKELKAAYEKLDEAGLAPPLEQPEQPRAQQPRAQQPPPSIRLPIPAVPRNVPVGHRNASEMPGQRLNKSKDGELEPIRTDPATGYIWYQEEVRKPATAKPRGRRVLTYQETGVEQTTVQEGRFTETFEIAGSGAPVSAQVKITLPSYQVGIYRDPRLPFKIYVYDERRGFDREEVEAYYGGPELVHPTVKKVYVENVLCYDVRSVIRAIQEEAREQRLAAGRSML